MRADLRPTLHQPPPNAPWRALAFVMNDPSAPLPGERMRCPGHRWLADTIEGGKCDEISTTPEPVRAPYATSICLLRQRCVSRRPATYLNAKRWRANEVTEGPTGYRNRAMFEMLTHGIQCGLRQRAGVTDPCTCPPGYAAWWHSLPAPHPVVRYWEPIPPPKWPTPVEGEAIAELLHLPV